MASPIALVTFTWTSQPTPLPVGTSPVDHFLLIITDTNRTLVFQKNGIPAAATSYTTTTADNLTFVPAGNPYTVTVTAYDASGFASLAPAAAIFEALPPVNRPYTPAPLTVGTVSWA
jgi:hypothetical protein